MQHNVWKSLKLSHWIFQFCHFRQFLSDWKLRLKNVNVARFTRNIELDLFCDFQTPWFRCFRTSTKYDLQLAKSQLYQKWQKQSLSLEKIMFQFTLDEFLWMELKLTKTSFVCHSRMRDFFLLPGEELEDVVKVIGCFCWKLTRGKLSSSAPWEY